MFMPRFYYILFGSLVSYGHKFYRTETEEKIRHIEITSQLIKNLFNDYEPWLRPEPNVGDNSPSVQIRVNISIANIKFNQDSQKLILNAFLSQQWLDKRLQYTPRVPFVILPKEKRIWLPETTIMDAGVLHSENTDKYFTVRIYPSGNALHVQKQSLELQCRSDFIYYPLKNNYYCSFTISSVSYTNLDVVYHWNSFDKSNYIENENDVQMFDLKQDYCIRETPIGNYSCLKIIFVLRGSFIQSLIYIYLPSTLMLICSWLHFWINASSIVPRTLTALVPFGIFSTFMMTRKNLHNSTISALDVWLIFCTFYTFLSFFQNLICIWYSLKNSSKVKEKSERVLLMETDFTFAKESCRMKKSKMDLLSRIVFLLIFIGFLIFYVVYYFV